MKTVKGKTNIFSITKSLHQGYQFALAITISLGTSMIRPHGVYSL